MSVHTDAPEHGAAPHLDLDVHHDAGTTTVRCAGDLVVRTSPLVRDAIADAVAGRPRRIVIDLADLSRLDAAGLVAVTAPAIAGRRTGHEIRITPPVQPSPRHLADLVGVLPLLGRPS